MRPGEIIECLELNPIIAAIRDDGWDAALHSPAQVLFYLSAEVLTVAERIRQAHEAGKYVLVHADLAEGIGKDRAGLRYLAKCGADGILSTKAQLIRYAKELELITVQRFFVLDSRGMESIDEMLRTSCPHLMEIMPGVIPKAISKFSKVLNLRAKAVAVCTPTCRMPNAVINLFNAGVLLVTIASTKFFADSSPNLSNCATCPTFNLYKSAIDPTNPLSIKASTFFSPNPSIFRAGFDA